MYVLIFTLIIFLCFLFIFLFEMPRKRYSNLSMNSSQARTKKIARSQESSVHAELRRQEQAERQSALRANETLLQTQLRLEKQAQRQAAIRATKTPEQSQARRIVNTETQNERRRTFMRNNWSVFNNSGFEYDPLIDYKNHILIVVGLMNKKCQFCDALKWKDETTGMCCSNSFPSFTW